MDDKDLGTDASAVWEAISGRIVIGVIRGVGIGFITMRDIRLGMLAVFMAVSSVLTACANDGDAVIPTRGSFGSVASMPPRHETLTDGDPVRMTVDVLARYPHDDSAFTQGLAFDDQGNLFESTGKYGRSSLRQVDVPSGETLRKVSLDKKFFGEGLTYFESRLVMLTWRESTAIVFDAVTFRELERINYDGEGWGLCFNGADLVMSDGSADLVFRDPATFAERRRVTVVESGTPVRNINELECVDDRVFANQWRTNRILEIDPSDGAVTAVVDASGLLSETEAGDADVLNGIAYDPLAGTFLITGKNWPWLFEARFVA